MSKELDWETKGININGEKLIHLKFADDDVIIAGDLGEATRLLEMLYASSHKVGLKINTKNTQFMINLVASGNISVNDIGIKQVPSYKYLCHEIRINCDNQTTEITRIIIGPRLVN